MKDSVCYVDGSFVPIDEAKVSVLDRGFTSGEGVYDVTRSYGQASCSSSTRISGDSIARCTTPSSIAASRPRR